MNVKDTLILIRGLVRPISTLALLGAMIGLSVADKFVPEPLASLTVAVIAFWFGSRQTPGKPE
jgi:4-hydroxybenzoate polyprenyltransferase